jgi:hypothetical protein
MKFEIELTEDQVNAISEEINNASDRCVDDIKIMIAGEIDKNSKYRIENICVYGECTTEWSSGNLIEK